MIVINRLYNKIIPKRFDVVSRVNFVSAGSIGGGNRYYRNPQSNIDLKRVNQPPVHRSDNTCSFCQRPRQCVVAISKHRPCLTGSRVIGHHKIALQVVERIIRVNCSLRLCEYRIDIRRVRYCRNFKGIRLSLIPYCDGIRSNFHRTAENIVRNDIHRTVWQSGTNHQIRSERIKRIRIIEHMSSGIECRRNRNSGRKQRIIQCIVVCLSLVIYPCDFL